MSEGYLLDTNIASIAWDGDDPRHQIVRERLEELTDAPIAICSISYGEVTYGLQVSPNADLKRQQMVRAAMGSYFIWHIDRHTAEIWANLRAGLFKQFSPKDARGRLMMKRPEDLLDDTTSKVLGIQENDLWIVSVAIQYNLHFITGDKMPRILEIAAAVERYTDATVWTFP